MAAARAALLWAAAAAAAAGASRSPLPPHPRLLLDDAAMAALRARVASDPTLGGYVAQLSAAGQAILATPPIAYPNCTVVGACRNAAIYGVNASYIDAGGAQTTVLTCALLHRLNGTNGPTPWSDRAIAELTQLVSFPSWYWPVGQALERAELAFAAGVGYDWLYPLLSASQRAALEDAMGTLVLQTRARDERQGMWWTRDGYNWNINSNAPLLAVTLALGDVPAWGRLAASVQTTLLADLPAAVASFAPDGVWPEGPSYQGYTSGSLIHGAASLLSATGGDGGLLGGPGVCSSGLVSLYATGPSLTDFNFADAHPGAPVSSTLFYLAGACGAPVYAAAARALRAAPHAGPPTPEDVMWYSPAGGAGSIAALPLAAVYADPSLDAARGAKTHLGSFRTAWGDPQAAWVCFKGGQNHFDDHGSDSHNNHGHLDVGAFVLESAGVRWVVDLGPGKYDFPLLAYFGRFRWGYALTSSDAHNVLRFDEDTQHRWGEGRIVAAEVDGGAPWALMDVTKAYGGSASVLRNVSMAPGGAVTVADAWVHPTASVATFKFHTVAAATPGGGAQGSCAVTLADVASGATVQVTATPADGSACAWTATLLSPPFPQEVSYDGLPVYTVAVTVPAAVGGLVVTFHTTGSR